jgi:O-acetyl-ADP-ribose deacetylase (regulator of RNase III)
MRKMKLDVVPTGDVLVSGPGNLRKCKAVIHAVGPNYTQYPNKQQAKKLLETTVKNCLKVMSPFAP